MSDQEERDDNGTPEPPPTTEDGAQYYYQPGIPTPPPPGPWGFWATMGFTVLAFIVSLVSGGILAITWITAQYGFPPELSEGTKGLVRNGDFITAALTLDAILGLTLIFLLIHINYIRNSYPIGEYLAIKRPAFKWLLLWVAIAVGYDFGAGYLMALLGLEESDWMIGVYQSASCLPCLWVGVGLLAPVWEEVFHRGFIFKGVEARLGPYAAIFFCVAPWALLHSFQYEWYFLVLLTGRGLISAIARWRTGSLFVPIMLHAVDNLLASVAMEF